MKYKKTSATGFKEITTSGFFGQMENFSKTFPEKMKHYFLIYLVLLMAYSLFLFTTVFCVRLALTL